MKYLKLFNSETEYITYKNSEDYITPNICIDKLAKKVWFNKKLKKLFPCYLQTSYSTSYIESDFIRIHTYTVQLESSQLYDTIYNNLIIPDGDIYGIVPEEFLNENPIYIDGHQVSSINQEASSPLYVSTIDNYPFSQYYDDTPGSVYGEYSGLGTNQLVFNVEVFELPDVLNYTTGNDTDMNGITNYLITMYSEYLFYGEPVYFDEHYNENICINGNKIYSVSYKECFDIMYLEFTHSADIKYLYDGTTLIQDINFPVQLTSVEGRGIHRTVPASDKTKNLLNHLNMFCTWLDDGTIHYEFTFSVGGLCPFIEIDGIPIRNPIGHSKNDVLTYITISDGGNCGATLYPDGSITLELDD